MSLRARFWNLDRPDRDNQKSFTKTILLTSKIDIYEKLNEPCEPQFNLTDLKIADDCHDSRRFSWFRVFFFFFFWYFQARPLMKLQPQTLRSHHYLFLFFFSISLTFSLCIFADCFSAFSLSLRFVCCFCSFLPLAFFLWTLESCGSLKMIDNLYSVTY